MVRGVRGRLCRRGHRPLRSGAGAAPHGAGGRPAGRGRRVLCDGYWVRDKFCPDDADGAECTDYSAPADQILDLQFRTTADLALNAFWPQNYITEDAMGTLTFDQMVVATTRIGCLR